MFKLSDIQKRGKCNVLQYFETANSLQLYSYADLYRQSIELSSNLQLLTNGTTCNSTSSLCNFSIGILLPAHSPALLPAIVGIEISGCVICFLDPNQSFQVHQRLIDFQSNIVLCDVQSLSRLNAEDVQIKILSKWTLFNVACALIQFQDLSAKKLSRDIANGDKTKSSDVFFYASTSGSCGEVKPIGVTYKCFLPNIISFGQLYDVTEQDVILVSSPPTFDPFMVDICLALQHGACLLMTNHTLRCDAKQLLDILFPINKISNITIMQMTPSLFMRWPSSDITNRIFSSKSQLRILAFGGEPFPAISIICKWTNWETNLTRIFNLYGLTEMSCWASVYEITRNDILNNQKIPIGQPIDEHTSFEVSPDGKLLLKSKIRKCYQPQLTNEQVIDDQFEFVLHTGDLVDIENESIYFTSRSNSVIKFYGRKINLGEIEACTKNLDHVEDTICLHDEKHNLIVLFAKIDEHFDDTKGEITKFLQKFDVHTKIHCVSEFPLTAHGKVCRKELLNIWHINKNDTRVKSFHLVFQELVNESLGSTIQYLHSSEPSTSQKKLKGECQSSFVHLGGSSLKAIQIAEEFERITSHSIPQLLPMLLNEQISIREILFYLASKYENVKNLDNGDGVGGDPNIDCRVENITELVAHWKIDMKKCIDATPTVCILSDRRVVVSVGSHSKLLYNILVSNGDILSKLELPDRIESQVIQMNDSGIVGCYDGHVYCFDIQTGTIKWKFNSGAMIKCRPLLINSYVLFGNYNESTNFWCLNANNGTLHWSQRIGVKSIYANPIKLDDKNCFVCSLNGTVALVNFLTSNIRWTFESKAPVFATPSVYRNHRQELHIIVSAVNGTIYALNSDGGLGWSYQIDGNIFSSLEYFSCSNEVDNVNFVLGSQNHNLYCIQIDANSKCKEVWRYKTSASIRSNPLILNKRTHSHVGIFSSDGIVHVINCDNGKLIGQRKINGDVFSSHAMHDGKLFVGSRNNFVYCIDLNDLI